MTATALPCLYSNNCIENTQTLNKPDFNETSTQHKKSSFALETNVKAFIDMFGLNNVGFLTLTFKDHVVDPKEAQRRFHSLRTNFLSLHFNDYIRVIERCKSGRIHYHLIVNCGKDIRTGLSFSQIKAKNYRSACLNLRKLWEILRNELSKYGFGRAELLPVKTNSKGLSKYISKYIGKHIQNRLIEDKGIRLVQFSYRNATWRVATCNFSFWSEGTKLWINGVRNFAERASQYYELDINQDNYSIHFKNLFGKNWAFNNKETIFQLAK